MQTTTNADANRQAHKAGWVVTRDGKHYCCKAV
jgi:hypothetical protein